MKSQDILVLLKIFLKQPDDWTMAKLAHELFMSKSEIHAAIKRLKAAGLMRDTVLYTHAIPNPGAMEEFLVHGLKYVFPAEEGKEMRGMPTSHSAAPLSELFVQDEQDKYVWGCEFGDARGKSISPLYSSAPKAAERDKELYEFLVLIDGIRIGKAREAKASVEELKKRLEEGSGKFKDAF
jgi:DNA-binding Lrp family transcriptional regulator